MPFLSRELCPMPFEKGMPYVLNFPANEVRSYKKVSHITGYAFLGICLQLYESQLYTVLTPHICHLTRLLNRSILRTATTFIDTPSLQLLPSLAFAELGIADLRSS